MVERFEKVSKIISKHVDSEIARANNSKKLQVKDGGRHLCEAIVVKQILAITQSEINLAVAKERERIADKIKYKFNGYGGNLGFDQGELLDIITNK